MQPFQERLIYEGGQASLKAGGANVSDLLGRLETLGPGPKLSGVTEHAPIDWIAALTQSALGNDDALGPGLVQAKPQRPKLEPALSEPFWAGLFPGAPHGARLALAAGLLQVHDFWDGSHDAAQRADDIGEVTFSAFWHGIAHRREPDAGNAAYWFRRAARHPVFQPLARAARPLLEAHGDSQLTGRLLTGDTWNAPAMITLCTQAQPGTPEESLGRRLQRLEMWLLLEATFAAVAPARA